MSEDSKWEFLLLSSKNILHITFTKDDDMKIQKIQQLSNIFKPVFLFLISDCSIGRFVVMWWLSILVKTSWCQTPETKTSMELFQVVTER